MTVSNLSVCLAPTLMQPTTMSEIFLDMKWCNVVIETLISNYQVVSAGVQCFEIIFVYNFQVFQKSLKYR